MWLLEATVGTGTVSGHSAFARRGRFAAGAIDEGKRMYDVAIIGGGMAGAASALRLQASGLATIVFEAHGQPGGFAGFFRRKGFSFDVGATTLPVL